MGRDPEYLAFARLVEKAMREQERAAPTVEQERIAQRAGLASIPRPAVSTVDDLVVSGADGPLPARLYRPAGTATTVFAFFHGGGFYLGDVPGYDPICRVLCNATGAAILSVGYRLAPEHLFPAGADDAYAATRWAAEHLDEFGFERLGVAGDSAGANLAAGVALRVRDARRDGDAGAPTLALQVLVYGAFDLTRSPEPVDDPDGLVLGRGKQRADEMRQRYLGDADPSQPLASPLHASDLTDLPPAVFAHAEYDAWQPTSVAYAVRLRAAGVPVTEVAGTGLDHAYLAWGAFARRPAEAIAELGVAVRSALAL
jgi:acetyl esterase